MSKAGDNYTVVLTRDFPQGDPQEYIDFIEKKILNRPNEEVIEVRIDQNQFLASLWLAPNHVQSCDVISPANYVCPNLHGSCRVRLQNRAMLTQIGKNCVFI